MRKRLNNEQGLTLAELLATLVIGSLIIILIMSAFVFVQKQFTTQKGTLQENTDISIALTSITRDVRFANTFEITGKSTLIITKDSEETNTYALDNNILKLNDANYIYDVNSFEVSLKKGNKFEVKIESNSGKVVSTEIVIRR